MERIESSYHSIMESMKTSEGVLYISKSNRRIEELVSMAGEKKIVIKNVSDKDLDRLAGNSGHKGVLYIYKVSSEKKTVRYGDLKEFIKEKDGAEQLLVLLLDGITDPHNLGAILRSADQFSVDLVILPGNRSAGINDTVAKVSVGAHAWVPRVEVTNAARALESLKDAGFWIYGADMGGSTAPRTDLKGRTCIVMGSEGKGISRLLKEKCDTMVSIPTSGHVDSLNVSVAAGILMYEVIRQRG